MRLNWFSPLAPQRTDIAHYTARIAAALMDRFEVEFWTDLEADPAALPPGAVIRRFDPAHAGTRAFNQEALKGINLYNLGNDSRFHSGIAQVAQTIPGVVILHDTRLHHFTFVRSAQEPAPFSSYLAAAQSLYGPQGLEIARQMVAAQGVGIEDHVEAMPFAELYLSNALGVLCHSQFAAAEIRARNDIPVLELPLPFQTLSAQPLPADRPSGPPWRLVMFGYLNRNRRLESVIEALAIWRGKGADFRFDLFGSLWDEALARGLVERHGLGDRVHIHGFASEAELDAAIAQAHLAFNLRHPTMGEASGGILRAWAFATPAVVTDEGWYARLPAEVAVKIPSEGEVDALVRLLDALAASPEAFRVMGWAAHARLRQRHTPQRYATLLAEALEDAPVLSRRIAGRVMLERAAERMPPGPVAPQVLLEHGFMRTVQVLGWPSFRGEIDTSPVVSAKAGALDWEREAELIHHDFIGAGAHRNALRRRRRTPIVQDVLFYDVSDLLIFLWVHGFVSGIQRVQLELLAATLDEGAPSAAFGAVEFTCSEYDLPWRLPVPELRELLAYAQTGRVDLDAVRDIISRLKAKGRAFMPGEGSVYFAPGAFWAGCVGRGLSDTVHEFGARFGVLIHDLFPITLPGMSEENTVAAFEGLLRDGLSRWDFFVTNSRYTASELRSYARRTAPWPMTVIPVPLAHAYTRATTDAVLPEGLEEGGFVLCVGTIEPRKNHAALLQAWFELRARFPSMPKLVLVGRAGWRSEQLVETLRRERDTADDLVWLETVSDAELDRLYASCLFAVYPSLAEGWGLPVGEALAAGKVCVTSRQTALPEVGGDFVVYADPPDAAHLAEAMGRLIGAPEEREALERRIADDFHPRTWRQVAEDLLEVLSRQRVAPQDPPGLAAPPATS